MIYVVPTQVGLILLGLYVKFGMPQFKKENPHFCGAAGDINIDPAIIISILLFATNFRPIC